MTIAIAAASNCVVAGITLALSGWTATGLHAAARNTARFSMLCFCIAFAAPGLVRLIHGLPSVARLMHAFVAAHAVHFAVVALLIVTFDARHAVQHPARAAEIVLIGFAIVVVAGLTATSRASRLYTGVHRIAVYAVFLIFLIAFVRNPVKPVRLFAVPLGIALIMRLTSGVRFYQRPIEPAEQHR